MAGNSFQYFPVLFQYLGPKNACSYVDLAMAIIDKRTKSGEIKPNLWWRYRDDIFPLVLDFNPRLPSIGKIIRKHKHLIYNSPSLKNIFPVGSIIPAFRRTKNIKEILSSKPREQHRAPDNQRGCFKCTAKCDLCQNFLKESNCFTSTSTSRTYPITQILSCKSKNVIYSVTCKKFNVQYVGSTSNEFKIRFRNHKSSMITKKRTCEVAIHFNNGRCQEYLVVFFENAVEVWQCWSPSSPSWQSTPRRHQRWT